MRRHAWLPSATESLSVPYATPGFSPNPAKKGEEKGILHTANRNGRTNTWKRSKEGKPKPKLSRGKDKDEAEMRNGRGQTAAVESVVTDNKKQYKRRLV